MKKRLITLILALGMLLGMTACGGSSDFPPTPDPKGGSETKNS